MKKIIGFLFLFFVVLTAQTQTVDEILSKFEAAVGGREVLQSVKTVQYKSDITLNMMGNPMDVPVTVIKENGKLLRREVSGIMGMGKSYSILTDTAGYFYAPPMRGFGGGDRVMIRDGGGGPGSVAAVRMDGPGSGSGMDASITKINSSTLAEEQYELDAAGAFGHLVNYASKGHKAELLGTSKINKVECFKIKCTLNSGLEIMYYVDSKTFFVVQAEAVGRVALEQFGIGALVEQMGSDRAKKMKLTITYSDYQDVNGVKFPMKEKLEIGAVEINMVNSDYKINETIDPKFYKLG